MMDELVAWLRGVLDDDEAIAGSATSGPWNNNDPMARDFVFAPAVATWAADCCYESMGPFAVHNATHIARHDPATVLADIAAKRALLTWMGEPDSEIEPALRILASAYADRPGYRDEWRP